MYILPIDELASGRVCVCSLRSRMVQIHSIDCCGSSVGRKDQIKDLVYSLNLPLGRFSQ